MARTPETIFYPTYNPPYTPYNVDAGLSPGTELDKRELKRSGGEESEKQSTSDIGVVHGPWWMLGFDRKHELGLFSILGGAAIGFCLAGAQKLSFPTLIKHTSTPVEGYWYQKSPWKTTMLIHIFTTIPATFFSVFCFLPITFKLWPRVHGAIGYIVSILLIVSCMGGVVAARRAQGGELGVQLGYYLLGSGATASVVIGCIEGWRGAFDAHREWMLRAWIYNGALVTTHATVAISARIISLIGSYYTPMRCSEIEYLKSLEVVSTEFAQCSTPAATVNPDNVYVTVRASWAEGKLGQSSASRAVFGRSMLLAIFLHCVGVELYVSQLLYPEA